jgi:hypothetical protein
VKSPRGDIVHTEHIRAQSDTQEVPSSKVASTTLPDYVDVPLADRHDEMVSERARNERRTCTLGGSIVIPHEWSGGEYWLRIKNGAAAMTWRKIQIRGANYRTPRLNIRIDFVKKGYGAGDEVMATVKVVRAEGGIPIGATVSAAAIIDGNEVFSTGEAKLPLNQDGHTVITFTLPKEMSTGEGTLNVIVSDGGTVESNGKTIPILLQTLDIQIYPEGGSLIAGVDNTVYVEAHTPTGDPADIVAVVVSTMAQAAIVGSEPIIVATVETVHEGRGKFVFKPTIVGTSYELQFLRPSGIKPVPLPSVQASGVALSIPPLVSHDQLLSMTLSVASSGSSVLGKYQIYVYHHERAIAIYPLTVDDPTSTTSVKASITIPSTIVGVLRVTVVDFTTDLPIVERLVYRPPASQLRVGVVVGKVIIPIWLQRSSSLKRLSHAKIGRRIISNMFTII